MIYLPILKVIFIE